MGSSKSLRIVTAAFAIALVGCVEEKLDNPICAATSSATAEVSISEFASGYFPAEYGEPTLRCDLLDGPRPVVDAIESEWYAEQWQAASEPSFYKLAQCEALPQFALRFSYIPSFDPSVFIRIESDEQGLKLIAKQLTGAGGYEPGEIGRSKELRLTTTQVSDLRDLLEAEALFVEPPHECNFGLDGSQWIFELIDKDGYRMVKRWSPDEGAARRIGMHLIDLSGWDIDAY